MSMARKRNGDGGKKLSEMTLEELKAERKRMLDQGNIPSTGPAADEYNARIRQLNEFILAKLNPSENTTGQQVSQQDMQRRGREGQSAQASVSRNEKFEDLTGQQVRQQDMQRRARELQLEQGGSSSPGAGGAPAPKTRPAAERFLRNSAPAISSFPETALIPAPSSLGASGVDQSGILSPESRSAALESGVDDIPGDAASKSGFLSGFDIGDAAGYGVDGLRYLAGLAAASTPDPVFEGSSDFEEYGRRVRSQAGTGLDEATLGIYRDDADRAFAMDREAALRTSGGNAGLATAAIGAASQRRLGASRILASMDQRQRDINLSRYGDFASQDLNLERMKFEDKRDIARETRMGGAQVAADAFDDLRNRTDFLRHYGEGSIYSQFLEENLERLRYENELLEGARDAGESLFENSPIGVFTPGVITN